MAASAGMPPTSVVPRRRFGRFWLAVKQLFHEVIGAIFGVLALVWIQSALRAWTRDVAHWLVGVAFGMAALMAVFSWTSFRKAKQIRAD